MSFRPARPPPRRLAAAVVRLLALGMALLPCATASAADAGAIAKFRAFERAWTSRGVDAIVACMEEDGTVVLQLLGYPLSGRARSMKPQQAKATLKTYFKKVSAIGLEDVSPEKSPENVRLYEYTYKPAGENPRTTHLRVQLKQDKNRLWVLASVNESVKPRE